MKESQLYRREKLALQCKKVKVAGFESKMKTAEILRKADPSMGWEEALRKAAALLNKAA